jgi:cGMP-dependent protein kinase
VFKEGLKLRTISMNDYFGERALLFDEVRSATVIADGPVECWVLGK